MFSYLKYSPIYESVTFLLNKVQKIRWNTTNKQSPPPSLIKQQIVKEYAQKYSIDTFIETGTYLGSMVDAVKKNFKDIYTIELDEKLYKRAVNKFKKNSHIKIVKGDSAKALFFIL